MLVCICKGITDKSIEDQIHSGTSSFSEIRKNLGLGSCCGQCASYAKELISNKISQLQLNHSSQLAFEIKC